MILPQGTPTQRESVSAFTERLVAGNPPRLYLPEDKSRPDTDALVFRVGYRSEAERIAALVGPRDLGQAVDASTDHALLVVLGEYARQVGLIERLQAVPIDQRQGDYTPQSKLIEFLIAILAGLEHLEDLSQATNPLLGASWLCALLGRQSHLERSRRRYPARGHRGAGDRVAAVH